MKMFNKILLVAAIALVGLEAKAMRREGGTLEFSNQSERVVVLVTPSSNGVGFGLNYIFPYNDSEAFSFSAECGPTWIITSQGAYLISYRRNTATLSKFVGAWINHNIEDQVIGRLQVDRVIVLIDENGIPSLLARE